MEVKRIYVKKKQGFDIEAKELLADIQENLAILNLKNVIILNRYDVEGITKEALEQAKNTIFSEPQVDECYIEEYPFQKQDIIFGVEYLPGQFDQRANAVEECLQILLDGNRPTAKTAKIYILQGDLQEQEVEKIKKYKINQVDSRQCSLEKPQSLQQTMQEPQKVEVVEGFIKMTKQDAEKFYQKYGFAMDFADLQFCQNYFKEVEKRDPNLTEMKMIDTYWSDHCRHTTFLTKLEVLEIKWDFLEKLYKDYLKARDVIYENKKAKDICLMDIATIATKELKKAGYLKNLDESEEINACSIKADILVDGKPEEYLIMFKNETHNHPTEIEPFGGAATCLGGAIRDPLSGRVYVYQAMRITGCGDPRKTVEETLPNKLPQRKLTNEAARGYSSYGNQIGLATGQVAEIYHEGYVAKRMEIGALVGAAPKENVVRKRPLPGDIVILLGGKTGRDGCGGATGSSKAHTSTSLTTCGAEVQKGNAPEERKIQRLFRNPEVTKLIKRCNDFGAGGVSVAIGELADGLEINLDNVPKKYEGLNGTELAISESQERMAVVVDKEDAKKLIAYAQKENLEATIVAKVVQEPRIKMYWRGDLIVNIAREFLDTNGDVKSAKVQVVKPEEENCYFKQEKVQDIKTKWEQTITSLNCCSQKGLVERFDSSIGSNTVIMPFGGKHQLTPAMGMVARIPTKKGYTESGTIMTYGYNPYLASWSPFHGAVYAIIESISKYVALGGDYKKAYLTLQEYFEKLRNEETRWGKPFVALLGAYYVQKQLKIAAIGGKDSMSGSYNELDVPPTLVSFCVGQTNTTKTVSNEWKNTNSKVVFLPTKMEKEHLLDFEDLKENYEIIHTLIQQEKVLSVSTITHGGIADVITKSAIGNKIGFQFQEELPDLFYPYYGSFIIELKEGVEVKKAKVLGKTIPEEKIIVNQEVSFLLDQLIEKWEKPLEKVFPTKVQTTNKVAKNIISQKTCHLVRKHPIAKPRVLIPVFPGTNCEYDIEKAFEDAGGIPNIVVFKNLKPENIQESIEQLEKEIQNSQIIMLPGGFSSGDEPDGSGKFIGAVFRNPKLKETIHRHLYEQDGLILGICNGFQALIKLGLLPYGEIKNLDETAPTLTFNTIGRHVSKMVQTKVVSKMSPWFSKIELGEEFTIPISHGEGRFMISEELEQQLIKNGQIATQYVDLQGNATYDIKYNPNGSIDAIEGITSPDGRILGKMGHSERSYREIEKNIPGKKDQKIFESGVSYYK